MELTSGLAWGAKEGVDCYKSQKPGLDWGPLDGDHVVEGWAVMAHRDPGSNPILVEWGEHIGLIRAGSDGHEDSQGLSFESASASHL